MNDPSYARAAISLRLDGASFSEVAQQLFYAGPRSARICVLRANLLNATPRAQALLSCHMGVVVVCSTRAPACAPGRTARATNVTTGLRPLPDSVQRLTTTKGAPPFSGDAPFRSPADSLPQSQAGGLSATQRRRNGDDLQVIAVVLAEATVRPADDRLADGGAT